MKVDSIQAVSFGRRKIEFRLKFSSRRTLAITVKPDLSVTVTAPVGAEMEKIREKVRKRAAWILRQQDFFRAFLPTQPPRRYVSGETHYYLGRQYRLKIIEDGQEEVKLKGGYFEVRIRQKNDPNRIAFLLDLWLLSRAQSRFQHSLEKCWEKFRRHEILFPQIRIRKMSKRWGGCNDRGVIYLNPHLIKAPSHCIDYVVTHELCHLKHPNHGKAFYDLLRRVMPDWETRKQRLEKIILP